jgi:hypothetical protein
VLAEDDLRLPLPEGAVVIDAREREIFVRKVTQPGQRGVGRQTSRSYVRQQCLELRGFHATAATGSR